MITKDWIFGSITYDAKNDIEKLISLNDDLIEFPDLFFFQPKKLFFSRDSNPVINMSQPTNLNKVFNFPR